jgi:hypothetical protein
MLRMAEPSTNMSPGSTSGMSVARADENDTPVSMVQNSRTHSAAKGKPGMAISPTVPTRNRSQTIITRRRGKRSARPDGSGPPTIGGR